MFKEGVDIFNTSLYLGRWYEIAKYPTQYYSEDCKNASADYSLINDNTIQIVNICYDESWTPIRDIVGEALINENYLYVKFGEQPEPQQPNYIVHATKYDEWSIVGSYDKKSLYILCRDKLMKMGVYLQVLNICREYGYDTGKLENDFNMAWYQSIGINLQKTGLNSNEYGLSHKMRLAYLVDDLIRYYLKNLTANTEFREWMQQLWNQDLYVNYKIQLLAIYKDKNFDDQLRNYASIFVDNVDYSGQNFHPNIKKILSMVYDADLRRFPECDKNTIFQDMKEVINDDNLINYLWERSGIYLKTTGDRDMELNKDYYCDHFHVLSQNPQMLAEELYNV